MIGRNRQFFIHITRLVQFSSVQLDANTSLEISENKLISFDTNTYTTIGVSRMWRCRDNNIEKSSEIHGR